MAVSALEIPVDVNFLDEIYRGTATVIEIWILDEIGAGKFSSILTRGGLYFQVIGITPSRRLFDG